MNPGDVHGELREEADRWSADHAEMKPPPAPSSPPPGPPPSDKASPASSSSTSDKQPGQPSDSSSSSSSSTTSDKAPAMTAEVRKARFEMAEKIATFIWGVADVFVPKYLGKRMKLEPEDEAKLVRVTVPVVEKRLPKDIDGEISDEEILLGTIAMVYGPKYFSPEPGQKEQPTPPGGDAPKPEAPAAQTSATVDGKTVEAQVFS